MAFVTACSTSLLPLVPREGCDSCSLRKHAYSNILKILPPKNENFQRKILIVFVFLLKTKIVGTRYNRLGEAVLTSTHKLCF